MLHALPQWAVSKQALKAVGLHKHWPELQWVYSTIDQNFYVFTQPLIRTSMGTIDKNLYGSTQPLARIYVSVHSHWLEHLKPCAEIDLYFFQIHYVEIFTDCGLLPWNWVGGGGSRSKSGCGKQNSPHTEWHNFSSIDNSEQCQVDFQKGRIQCFHHTCEEQTRVLEKEQLWKRVLVWS